MGRSVTDEEIGLIRAMLLRGMKNSDIQFYFNRQDRPVNSGRITGIRQGTYGAEVVAASEAALEAFLVKFRSNVIHGPGGPLLPPSDDGRIAAMFSCKKENDWCLTSGETDEI